MILPVMVTSRFVAHRHGIIGSTDTGKIAR